MQTQESNWVFVVSLGSSKREDCDLTWIEIVQNHMKYFHPLGGNGWPKEPPNYIAFRYYGQLQSIHHIEDYVVTKNLNDEIPEQLLQRMDFLHMWFRELQVPVTCLPPSVS